MLAGAEWVRAMFVRERALSGFLMWRPPPVEVERKFYPRLNFVGHLETGSVASAGVGGVRAVGVGGL